MAELTTLREAVAGLVHDGDTVALEGFTHLIPTLAGHEIIRQERRDLTLVRMTPDLVYDQMIGMGVARKLVFSWGGNPGVGSLHRFRDAVENGWPTPLEVDEHSHAGMATPSRPGSRSRCCALPQPPARPRPSPRACPFTGESSPRWRLNPDGPVIRAREQTAPATSSSGGSSGAEGGRPGRRPRPGHRGGGRRRARPPARCRGAARWVVSAVAVCPAAPPVVRERLQHPRQRLLRRLTRSAATATRSSPG